MRVRSLLAVAAATVISTSALFSQNVAPALIPQRLYFQKIPAEFVRQDPALEQLPEYIYTAIAAIQPVLRVEDPAEANSIVTFSASGAALEVGLEKDGENEAVERLADPGRDRGVPGFVDRTARRFAPLLEFVSPKIIRVAGSTAADTEAAQRLADAVRNADRYALSHELSLWGSGILFFSTSSHVSARRTFTVNLVPASMEFAWYLTRNFGLVGSVWTYYGEDMTFGRQQNSDGPGYVRGLFLLPGVGVTYRTLGQFFGSFGATAYAGYARITNITPEAIGRSDNSGSFTSFLAPGESRSIFYPLVTLSAGVGYNFSPAFALQTRVEVDFTPAAFYGDAGAYGSLVYPTDGSGAFFRLLEVGISYRF
ncbi:MAG TPA: hypothetical protein VMW87_00130 [Spirochaetia bacterium]|nr:hypothetical protein [Spirochaetia bacterium]